MLDLMENGAHSAHVPVALGRLQRMCAEMEEALAGGQWLMGADNCLADALVTAYFFRIDCIGLDGLWESRYPRVTDWYGRVTARPSLDAATGPWLDEAAIDRIRQVGRNTFIEDAAFPDYL